jgi:hypothetical protein
MKSLSPAPPPPLVLGSESEVLPRPLDPSAEELELDELDELDEEDDEDELEELLNRLVAAVNAEEALGAELVEGLLEELELAELDEEPLDGVELPPEPEESRPKPLRLPARFGVMSEAYWAAAVTPVSRRVRSTGPGTTKAVRIVDGPPGPPPEDAAGRARSRSQRYTPPEAKRTRRMPAIHRRRDPRDFWGLGDTTSGRTGGRWGASPGAGKALIYVGLILYRRLEGRGVSAAC